MYIVHRPVLKCLNIFRFSFPTNNPFGGFKLAVKLEVIEVERQKISDYRGSFEPTLMSCYRSSVTAVSSVVRSDVQ